MINNKSEKLIITLIKLIVIGFLGYILWINFIEDEVYVFFYDDQIKQCKDWQTEKEKLLPIIDNNKKIEKSVYLNEGAFPEYILSTNKSLLSMWKTALQKHKKDINNFKEKLSKIEEIKTKISKRNERLYRLDSLIKAMKEDINKLKSLSEVINEIIINEKNESDKQLVIQEIESLKDKIQSEENELKSRKFNLLNNYLKLFSLTRKYKHWKKFNYLYRIETQRILEYLQQAPLKVHDMVLSGYDSEFEISCEHILKLKKDGYKMLKKDLVNINRSNHVKNCKQLNDKKYQFKNQVSNFKFKKRINIYYTDLEFLYKTLKRNKDIDKIDWKKVHQVFNNEVSLIDSYFQTMKLAYSKAGINLLNNTDKEISKFVENFYYIQKTDHVFLQTLKYNFNKRVDQETKLKKLYFNLQESFNFTDWEVSKSLIKLGIFSISPTLDNWTSFSNQYINRLNSFYKQIDSINQNTISILDEAYSQDCSHINN